jgi:lysophospholipase L1-like esterase
MERYMARNGLHFTPEGYAMLGKAVAQAIRQELQASGYTPAEIAYTR